MVERIARTAYRRRRAVVVFWIGALVALSVIGSSLGGELRNNFSLPGSESQEATDLLEAGGLGQRGGRTGQIVFTGGDEGSIDDPGVRSEMESFFGAITAEVPEVAVLSPYAEEGAAQVAPDRDVAFAEVQFGDIEVDDATPLADEIAELRAGTEFSDQLQVELGGDLFFEESEFSTEAFGFLAAMFILLVAFGSVLAMGLPLLTALFGIGCGMAIVQMAALVFDIPDFAPAAVMMIAIGVGIDYALFIVTRFREELAAGADPETGVVRAMGTAGRAVLFAGTTVVISLAGLLVIGQAITQSLAVATSAGVLMVMLVTMTLLPALLGFVGRNIDRLSIHRRPHASARGAGKRSVWFRWSRVVQRHPAPIAIAGTVLLVALAAPVVAMRLGFGDAGNRPDTDTSRRAYDLVSESFGPGYNGPLFLAVDLAGTPDENAAALERLATGLAEDDGVDFALPPFTNDAGDVAFVQAFPETSPQDEATTDTVHRLRDNVVPDAVAGTPVEVYVGGAPAGVVDAADMQQSRLPVFIAVVLVLSFVLLMSVFRSVLVALKAVIMNLLSIGAAYGVIVALFQWGWGAGLLGLGDPGPIEAWAPMMLFAIIFGLSMDYEVFLLSRIKEEYDRTGRNDISVADGLASTARLITAAAAIMIVVFGGFVFSADRALQLFGTGMATAILVDATIVRLLLVPATMELLGDRNWWLPRWLDRLLPNISVEAPPEPVTARTPDEDESPEAPDLLEPVP